MKGQGLVRGLDTRASREIRVGNGFCVRARKRVSRANVQIRPSTTDQGLPMHSLGDHRIGGVSEWRGISTTPLSSLHKWCGKVAPAW